MRKLTMVLGSMFRPPEVLAPAPEAPPPKTPPSIDSSMEPPTPPPPSANALDCVCASVEVVGDKGSSGNAVRDATRQIREKNCINKAIGETVTI